MHNLVALFHECVRERCTDKSNRRNRCFPLEKNVLVVFAVYYYIARLEFIRTAIC